ncbi:hypothetical protein ACRE_042210 [Hapsidospora chrysogenum ATCC 11550]|uniref:Uncharacterized protein n=1 Tax=Hapsidospora chrysogenum (strain ATCC 11550 / CBS 779.69 / DSM 880 / IAM 14645 / JCM 23072 / IMI 49137) TaxID=857340 RepID=A0A086T6N6_HAPC1|nr:hypothetical protein ACRE_042210 [Hapsidospora chrysogenum ATCC 11550]
MAVPGANPVAPPDPSTLLTPILPALTAAAVSTEPAIGVLPLLSPILRQRVQFLSASSSDPWLRLLCYDASKARQLADTIASSAAALEPHPVSGEVEVDWDYDAQVRYRRVDPETLQALFVLADLGLAFQLVYCVGDPDGGDGWRVGEVTVADKAVPFATFGGAATIAEAEDLFREKKAGKQQPQSQSQQQQQQQGRTNGLLSAESHTEEQEENDDDDDYWALYDATPGRTPAQNRSPAPNPAAAARASITTTTTTTTSATDTAAQESAYFAQYDSVQPAMDNHDPDEEAEQAQHAHPSAPPLGLGPNQGRQQPNGGRDEDSGILHPRPESSASSNGSQMVVARLEEEAGRQGQSEFGVKQHISRSIRSLYLLSRASGIEREEFERLVQTELDVLGMVENES